QVVRAVEAEVRRVDGADAGAPAVRLDVRRLARDAERSEVAPEEAAELARRNPPRHQMVREIRERVAQRRELPVEHGDDAGLGGVEDEVVEAVVAVDDARLLARR